MLLFHQGFNEFAEAINDSLQHGKTYLLTMAGVYIRILSQCPLLHKYLIYCSFYRINLNYDLLCTVYTVQST